MSKLVSATRLGEMLNGVSPQAIYNKIARGSIPSEAVVYLPCKGKKKLRLDVDIIAKYHPSLKSILNTEKKNINRTNLIKVNDFANALGMGLSTVYRYIETGVYPIIELPAVGKNKIIRIVKDKTINKFPELKKTLEFL